MTDSKLERFVAKPAVVGGVGFALSKAVLPSVLDASWSKTLNFTPEGVISKLTGQTSVSVPIAVAVALMLGSLSSELAHEYIFPHIHWMEKSSEKASLLMAGGVSGGVLAGSLAFANKDALSQLGIGPILGAGLVAEVLGDYAWKFVKKPAENLLRD